MDKVTVKPCNNPREGWDEIFKQMNYDGDDRLLIDDVFDDEEFDE